MILLYFSYLNKIILHFIPFSTAIRGHEKRDNPPLILLSFSLSLPSPFFPTHHLSPFHAGISFIARFVHASKRGPSL